MTLKFALITPSFYGDYERCKLLVESVAKCIDQKPAYYLIIPRKDKDIFRNLQNIYPLTIIDEEELLPWYIFNNPFSRKWRLNLFGLPLRGWIAQQICKLNAAKIVREDVFVMVDSDVCLIKKINLNRFIKNEKVRLLSIEGRGNLPEHFIWHRITAKLLRLPKVDYFGNGYIGNVITWKRQNVIKLLDYLKYDKLIHQLKIVNRFTFSEYILYGVFSEFILKENSGHYKEEKNEIKEYWSEDSLSDQSLEEFFNDIGEEFAIMITSKCGLSADKIRKHVERIWAKI